MALPLIQGVVRAAVRGKTLSGAYWVNVHHMEYALGASTPGTTEIATLDPLLFRLYSGTAFGTGTAWSTKAGSGVTVEQIDYVILDGSSLGSTIPHAATFAGGTALPPECAAVLTLLTGKRGRRFRGRIYLPQPGVTTTDANGAIVTATRTNMKDQYMGMITQLASVQWRPVVASYGHGQHTDPITHVVTPTSWSPFATPIIDCRMDSLMDVQRARKTG